MLYKDNRDIRDNRYEGDLIIECTNGVSKKEALTTIKQIIQNDADYSQHLIDQLLLKIEGYQKTIDRCNLRLSDPELENIEIKESPYSKNTKS